MMILFGTHRKIGVMMLSEQIFAAAEPTLEGKIVTDLAIGISLIGIQLDDHETGVAYTLRDALPSGCGAFSFARDVIGSDAYDVASLCVTGEDDIQRGVAAAVLSAAASGLVSVDSDEKNGPFGVGALPNDRLALVGYMAPIAKQFSGLVADTVIFDRGRELAGKQDVTPCDLQDEILPTCDIVVVSGTSITNHSIDHLLEICTGAREFVLTGTSTPMFCQGYLHTGVTCLGGSLWKAEHKPDIFRNIICGGGIASCHGYFIKKNVRIRE